MAALGELDFAADYAGTDCGAVMVDICEFLQSNGLEHFSFAFTQRGGDSSINPTIDLKTTYAEAWAERYCERRYDQLDPLVQDSRSQTSPIIWGSDAFVRRLPKRQRYFFMEAREFGVNCGVSFPIRSVDGSIGLVTYTTENDELLADILNERGSKLWVAAHQIMDGFRDPHREEDHSNPLSPREREALIWVSEGCTSDEIAEHMFITGSAVNYHLGNATRKLRARNRHHAALIALKHHFI